MTVVLTPWRAALLVLTAALAVEGLRCFSHVFEDGACSPQDSVDDPVSSVDECCRLPEAEGYTEHNLASHSNGHDYVCKRCIKPVDGHWSEWSNDGPCSVTCGKGRRLRQRQCNDPAPSNGGRPCSNHPLGAVLIVLCTEPACPPIPPRVQTSPVTKLEKPSTTERVSSSATPAVTFPELTPLIPSAIWSDWTECSSSCGDAARERLCLGPGECVGSAFIACHLPPCPMTASADSRVDSSNPSSSFNYFLIAGVAGALLLFGLVVLVLWRTNVWCFQKKDLRLEALEAASVATYTRRHRGNEQAQSQSFDNKGAAFSEETVSPSCCVSYDPDGYEIPQQLCKPAHQNHDDEQHIYEEVTLLS